MAKPGQPDGSPWPRSPWLSASRAWLGLLSWLVPSSRREEWLEEWEAELWQLWSRADRSRRRREKRGAAVAGYVAGAPWSVLMELKEEWMSDLWQDVRYAVRTLGRTPGFLVVAVATLALGIGANTTVFSMVNGLLLREPAGIAAPEDLVRIGRGQAAEDRFDNWSYPVYRDLREHADWFSGVAGFASAGSVILGRGLNAEAVPAQLTSHNYFDVLGVRLIAGRGFLPEETATAGAATVAVISHDLWRRHFGARPDAVGATIPINGRELEVVGIAPADFTGSDVLRAPADLWMPASMIETAYGPGTAEMLGRRGSSWFWVFARLAPGVSFEQARAATETLYARFDQEHPRLAGQGIRLVRGIGFTPDDRERATKLSRLLLGIVLLVLLIACANLAGLALARGADRTGEMGVRAALGASRPRVVRQLLTESLLIAIAAGAAATGLTYLVAGQLHALVPWAVSVHFAPDARVLGFGLATALLAGLVSGLLPALRSSRTDLRTTLSVDSRSVAGQGRRLRRALVAAQLALSFVLLAGTGLLLRSVHNARTVDPGFDADRVATLALDAGMRSGYDTVAGHAFYDRLRERAAAAPGVDAVGLVAELPVVDFQSNHTPREPGRDFGPDETPPPPVLANYADAGYFDALGLPLLAGRTFRPDDAGTEAAPVAVIDRTLARRFFGDVNPVGRTLPFVAEPDGSESVRVIGVVAAFHNRSLRDQPAAQYWRPFDRFYRGDMTLVARTPGDPGRLTDDLRRIVQQVDPGMPILRAEPLRALIGGTLRETRLVSTLAAVFGSIALLLAAVGLYGVMAFSVTRRTRELGIRVAVGASTRDVLALVLRDGLRLAAVGLAAGLLLALAALRLLRGLLYDVRSEDPFTLLAGALLLLAVASTAALIPAWRAARLQPVTALRQE